MIARAPIARSWSSTTRSAARLATVALLATAVAVAASGTATASAGASRPTATLVGDVVSHATGAVVAGATISLPGYGLRATSDAHGTFRFPHPLVTDTPYRAIRAMVSASGFGAWTIRGAPLYPGQTLELHAELRSRPYVDAVLPPGRRPSSPGQTLPRGTGNFTCTGWTSQTEPPPTIAVASHIDGSLLGRYDFGFYLRHVLPSEWIPSWDADALGAGAIAAKDYAWYRAEPNHGYSGGAGCADLTDYTADQVFNPGLAYASTDLAVDATLGTLAWENDAVFLAQYWSGAPNSSNPWDKCAYVDSGPFAGRMSQYGTQRCALNGHVWTEIVPTFYPTASLHYTSNMLLDPSAEDANGYPWTASPASAFSRVAGSAYRGGYYFSVSRRTTVTQAPRLFDTASDEAGSGSTPYTLSVALLCPKTVLTTCTVRLKIVTVADDGTTVTQVDRVTERNDAKWRVYRFAAAASGLTHATVKAQIVTNQAAGFDMVSLTMPFGGP